MIEVLAQEDGEMMLKFQEDNDMGNFMCVNMDDHQALKLWLEMAEFLKLKRKHDVARLLGAADTKPNFWTRVSQALAHVLGG